MNSVAINVDMPVSLWSVDLSPATIKKTNSGEDVGKENPYISLLGMKTNVFTMEVSIQVSQNRVLLRVNAQAVSIILGPTVSAWSTPDEPGQVMIPLQKLDLGEGT